MTSEPALKIIPSEPLHAQNNNKSKKERSWVLIVPVIAGVCASVALSIFWFIYSQNRISTDNAFVDSDLFYVSTRIMGYVKNIYVKENDAVKQGQVLGVLDNTDFNVELSYKQAKLTKATGDWNRAVVLHKQRALSQADLELAQAALTAAQADFVGTQLKIKYTQIISPADGIVGKKSVESGQFIQPGQNLFVILPAGPLWIKANYKETQVGKIQPGQKVEISIDALPQHKFFGRVEAIFPSSGSRLSIIPPENATGNFTKVVQRIPVKIKFESALPPLVRPGMSVTATVLTQGSR